MFDQIQPIFLHFVVIAVASFILIRYHRRINRFIERSYRSIAKSVQESNRKRYARRVNHEEAKLFGRDKKHSIHSSHRSRSGSRSSKSSSRG
jgi:hypothetical protein